MFATLGNIQFSGVKSPTDFQRNSEEVFPEHALILDKPSIQHTGANLDVISLAMVFHASFCVPEDELKLLYGNKKSGTILPFVLGTGELLGNFVIAKMGEKRTFADGNGRIIAVMVDVELKENAAATTVETKQKEAVNNGFAISDNKPVIIQSVPIPPIPTAQATQLHVTTYTQSTAAAAVWQAKKNVSATLKATASRLRAAALVIDNNAALLLGIINAQPTSELYLATRDLAQTLLNVTPTVADIVQGCNDLITAVDNNNTTGVVAASAQLTSNFDSLKQTANQALTDGSGLVSLYNSKQ